MQDRDYRDIISGGIITLFGAFVLHHALTRLDLGTLRQMGPGMFPAGAGGLLVFFGAGIMLPAFFRRGSLPPMDIASLGIVIGAMLAFGLSLLNFGLVPALVLLTCISLMASPNGGRSWKVAALLSAFICGFVILVFRLGLGIRMQLFAWPF